MPRSVRPMGAFFIMPTPRKNETKKKFISRCIPIVIEDGTAKDNKQGFAVCNSMWNEAKKDDAMSNARKRRKQKALDKKDEKGLEHLGRVKAEALKVAEEPLADVIADELTDDEIKELVAVATDDKHGDVEEYVPYGGAQSWDELDEFLEAQATGEAIRETEWEFRKMMNNVLNDETMTLDQKSDKIADLASGFPGRAEQLAEENKDDEFDTVAKVLNFLGLKDVAKRRMTSAQINDLPDKAFAYIEPGGKKDKQGKTVPRSLRHFPIHDAAHVRNALARAAQGIKRGGKAAKNARAAMPKIRAAAKKLKIGKASGFIVQKDLEGNPRWFGWVSNKYRDRDVGRHPKGEIIAEAAHKEFIEYVDADPKNRMPALWIWHTPRTATKMRADWIDFADGFLLESGPLTDKEGVLFEALGEKHDLAMSHGFFKDSSTYDKENGVINRYRQIEASVLPRDHVANEWTDFATLQEVKEMFTPERREFLVDALGEEKVAELEASTKDMNEELKALGIEFKEQDPEEKPKEEGAEETPKTEDEGKSVVNVSLDADALIEQIGLPALSKYLEAQNKTIEDLTAKVEQLTKSDDDKIAEALTPKAGDQLLWLRPSESEETALKEGDELAESKPELTKPTEGSWVTEVMSGGSPASEAVPKS